jgi:hypothetical protein
MAEPQTYIVSAVDKADWRVLFDGSTDFYTVTMNDEILASRLDSFALLSSP